jgi:sterol 3beta-glucosyltransferase
MRWPRVSRKSRVQSDTDIIPPTNINNGDAPNDVSHDDLSSSGVSLTDPGLSRMFTDAALYERVLNAGPEALKTCLALSSERGLPACVASFNELIGRDLADNERLVTGRMAKLSVNNWATSTDDPFGVDAIEEEDQEEVGSTEGAQDEKGSPPSTPPTTEEEQLDEPKLTPEEIVDLLEQEFGALAPPGEEKLLLETDAAFFKDVIVLVGLAAPYRYPNNIGLRFTVMSYHIQGVVHVTTHRCTFHASLLSSQPGHNEKVVKSGTALIHRKGLYRKKRVWLQLDHDMVSSYPSSRDEDKIKPLRSILCLLPRLSNRHCSPDRVSQCPRSKKSSRSTGSIPGL